MKPSNFPDTAAHREFYEGLLRYLKTDGKTVFKAVRNDQFNEGKDLSLVKSMVGKILSGERLSKTDRRNVRVLLQRQVNHRTSDLFEAAPELRPVIDYAESRAMRLLEKGTVPAFHDVDRPDYAVPDFRAIPGNVRHLHVPHEYGHLYGYVPRVGDFRVNSGFIYTDSWVLDRLGTPLFQLDKDLREGFNHISSGHIGGGLFLTVGEQGPQDSTR